jgi:2',3'-cyclic-nucleotide 2'-phosphodiesterase (5'-nucleotidase family)
MISISRMPSRPGPPIAVAACALAAVLAAARASAADAPAAAADQQDTIAPARAIRILFHADLDGRFAEPACGKLGRPPVADYAALVAALGDARADAQSRGDRRPFALLGGNWAGPDPFAAALLDAGPRALPDLLGRAGYDAVALGHDELSLDDATLDALLPALARAGVPVVATNLTCDARRPACAAVRRDAIVKRGDATLGVLATLSPSVLAGIPPGRLAGFGLGDPADAIRAGVARLRGQGARVIVVMTDGPRDARALDEVDALARRLSGAARPDLVLGAGLADEESGRTIRLFRRDGAPPVVGSATGTAGVTSIRIDGRSVDVDALPPPDRADPDAEKLISTAEVAFCARASKPIAPAGVHGQLSRDDFINYVLEVMRRRAGAEIAVINRAFVKQAPFPITGPFTQGDLERAMPYGAVMGVARVQGPLVDSLLGGALANPKLAAVGLVKGSGGLQVNGRPLDKAREYRVATIAFIAGGGDGIFPPRTLPFSPLPGAPDLRAEVAAFLRNETGAEDNNPTIDPKTDFGPPPVDRPLYVLLGDGELDFSDTSITNGPGYTDTQLTRAQQTSVKGEGTLLFELRHPKHEVDGRYDAQYGWTRNEPLGMPAASGESIDLITAITTYTYRGLRDWRRFPRPAVPDPYARVWLESEFTRPDVTPTQPRTYHHLQLTNTAGAQFTLNARLKLRGGAGAQSELLAPDDMGGGWHAVIEAGATLDPTAIATFGALAVKLEGLVDYDFVDPTGTRQHQLRATGKLSVPLVPTLFITVGLDVFAVQREREGWGASYDTTIGLRLHTDFAHQPL